MVSTGKISWVGKKHLTISTPCLVLLLVTYCLILIFTFFSPDQDFGLIQKIAFIWANMVLNPSHLLLSRLINNSVLSLLAHTFWSHSAMCGAISLAAKSKATFWNSFCSSVSPWEAAEKERRTLNTETALCAFNHYILFIFRVFTVWLRSRLTQAKNSLISVYSILLNRD